MHEFMTDELQKVDPELRDLVEIEEERQQRKLIMIASESIAPPAVRELLASNLGHLYAEGYPSSRMCRADQPRLADHAEHLAYYRRYGSRRYYKGVEYADFVEALARRRAAELFANARVPVERIFANVQPLSGAAANNAVFEAFLAAGDPVLGMDLTYGGHLTHGHPVNRSGKHFRVAHYQVGPDGQLDYAAIRKLALEHQPRLIIAGYSAYPWDIDWARMRELADAVPGGAILHADIAHTAGLVAASVLNSPVGWADVISFTTHKTLCGPRGAIILTTDRAHADRVDMAVFPGEQGGPHIHQIAAKAVAFKIANTPEFKGMMARVLENAAALAESLRECGVPLAYGGTNTHMVMLDLRQLKTASGQRLSGEVASRLLDLCHITCNKNTIGGDQSAMDPGAIRLGTTWVTQRGLQPEHLRRIGQIVARVLLATHTLHYIGPRGDFGRARIEPGVLDAARQEVEALLDELAHRAEPRRGYPHFAAPEVAPTEELQLEVYGERAHLLLDHAFDQDVAFLTPGGQRTGTFWRPDGTPLARAVVTRAADDDQGRGHFTVRPEAGCGPALLHWLRDLSDGYALAEPRDLLVKPYGPAVVVTRPAVTEPLEGLAAPSAPARFKPFFIGQAGLPAGEPAPSLPEYRWVKPTGPARATCLYEEHQRRVEKSRIAEFAGWKLPVWFSSIADEHRAVRHGAGLFDVSHMGVLEFTGRDAELFLDLTTTAYVPALLPGQAKYSYLLDPVGRVIDDIMLYRMSRDRILMVVNAANAEEDEAWWRAVASGQVALDPQRPGVVFRGQVGIRNLKDPAQGAACLVDLALQGPAALEVLRRLVQDPAFFQRIKELHRFEHASGELLGREVVVARTGYTGAPVGFEILLHPDLALPFWQAVLEVGAPLGVRPAGLGARDTTRTEAGLPLHGHELAGEHGVNPIEAGYGSFVKLHKPFFVGRAAMVEAAQHRNRQIVRFATPATPGSRPIRPGHLVAEPRKGAVIGRVTSSVFVGQQEIGLALVQSKFAAPGQALAIFTYTDRDGIPAGKRSSAVAPPDWLPLSRNVTLLTRFPDPVHPFPEDE